MGLLTPRMYVLFCHLPLATCHLPQDVPSAFLENRTLLDLTMRLTSLVLLFATARGQETPPAPTPPPLPDWVNQFKCIIDLDSDQPSVIDRDTCTTRTDGQASCLWCDLSSMMGPSQGVCVNNGIKELLGQLWDTICSGTGSQSPAASGHMNPVIPVPSPTTSAPVPSIPVPILTLHPVTNRPDAAVNPTPAVFPSDDGSDSGGGFGGAFSCAMDSSSRMISDQATCVAKPDTTSTEGKNCVWCPVPLVGGGCITNSDAHSISWMCKSFDQMMETKNLRGVMVKGLDILDSSCLGDVSNDLGSEKASCGDRNDKNGNSCLWCDGAGVLGFCVSPKQKDVLGNYMTCKTSNLVAIE